MRRQKKNRSDHQRGGSSVLRLRIVCIGAVLGLVVLVLGSAWMVSRHSASQQNGSAPRAISDVTSNFVAYAGSVSCMECHKEAYSQWKASHHALAERSPAAALDESAFRPSRTFLHGSQHTTVDAETGQYQVVALAPTMHYDPFTVKRVIGHEPLRQFLVQFPGGRYQTLEASYNPRSNEWFNVYGNENRQPGEWGHWTGRGMNWNDMCATCHNTRVHKNYVEATDSYDTTMAEVSVGCEACHGPLKAHDEWQRQFGKSGKSDPNVQRLTRHQTVENCAFCHARRSDLTGDFKPGDDFFDHMQLSIVDGTGMFYPDGQVHEEDYEFTAFLGSRMHFKGVACNDCHNPHSGKTILPGNWLCMRCHSSEKTAPVIDPVAHSHHKVFGYNSNGEVTTNDLMTYKPSELKETGGECVNCHMPQTVYMQHDRRHDHGFTIPDPLLTKQDGTPNACNRCHQNKDADWSLAWTEKWYGQKMDRPTRRRAQVIAAARRGEVGARVGLLNMLATEEISYWRAAAAGLLGAWSREPVVRDALLHGLDDSNALIRRECVRALEPLANDTPSVGKAIRQRLGDPVRSVRIAAAWSLRSNVDPTSKAGIELLSSIQFHADQPIGQMQQGGYSLSRNNPRDALAHYQKAVDWDPNSAPIRHELAVVLSVLNRNAEAAAELETAIKLDPRNAEYPYKLALAWNELGDTQKTIAALETAVRLNPGHARAWYNLGLALNAVGRSEEALSSLIRAEAAAPSDPRNSYARATILAQLGRIDEARQAAKSSLEKQPEYAPAVDLLKSLP